jgi:hypothetical protein
MMNPFWSFIKNAAKIIFLAYFRSIVYTMQGQRN